MKVLSRFALPLVLLSLVCFFAGLTITSGRGGTPAHHAGVKHRQRIREVRKDIPLTPAGWRIQPAGTEFSVPKQAVGFQGPMGSALSPDGGHLLAVSSGAARIDSTDLFDLNSHRRTDFVRYDALEDGGPAVFYGVVYSPDGTKAWASGGGQNVVHVYSVHGDRLRETGQIQTPYFPAGLAYGHTPLGDRIYVANNLSAPTSGAGNPPGHQVTVIDPKTDEVTGTIDLGQALEPLDVTFDRTGRHAYVTNWMGRTVSVIDTATQKKVKDIVLSPHDRPLAADHPSAIAANPRRDEVYTANANSDTVSVIDTRTNRLVENIDVALVPNGPKGAIPDGLAVSPDGGTLYVAEAGENAVAVVNLDSRRVEGFIPTSWYPSDVQITPDGRKLVITNTQDSGAGANRCGPLTTIRESCPPLDPDRDPPGGHDGAPDTQYSGTMIKGSVQVVAVPRNQGRLRALTNEVKSNNQVRARRRPEPPVLRRNIEHVIYVIKENRTYDQVFGSLGKGNGDPKLDLFGDDSAPNHRALARRFVTLDNFYADAEVSADGHNWSTQAGATDYVDKTWPVSYSPRPRGSERAYDFEDVPLGMQFYSEPLASDPSVPRPAAAQTVGYLWDDAYAHGVSYRDYGEYTEIPGVCGGAGNTSDVTHLQRRFGDHVDTRYDGFNLECSDHLKREPEWEREFHRYEKNGNLPALEIVRLPNDHTMGTVPGAATPESYVADNDLALGRLVQTVSHSRYWKSTVIFVVEDDAQDGPDHVDAHRTVALAISPYTQTGKVDSTHYDTSSMIATIEDLLGLSPMSITDSRATRMWRSFTSHPNFRPYEAKQPEVTPFGDPGAPTNPKDAPMAKASSRMDFTREDATPEIGLNRAIWKSIKGRDSRMPAPLHEKIMGSEPAERK
ncbi:MAG: bifunctional YncE family protein/alkaline phosphatase family protein [Rubrobacteraceae bacterium]|nr:bifunctional YncE family protein/alkaline phosphatase family protein [Rubrobacteraceae bacterium]